jgi:DNA-binding NarL/FixJ family response regulator
MSMLASTISSFHLTPRQSELVERMCQGQSRQDIASEMGITDATIRSHLRDVFCQMKVTSSTGVVAAVLMRLLETADHSRPHSEHAPSGDPRRS